MKNIFLIMMLLGLLVTAFLVMKNVSSVQDKSTGQVKVIQNAKKLTKEVNKKTKELTDKINKALKQVQDN